MPFLPAFATIHSVSESHQSERLILVLWFVLLWFFVCGGLFFGVVFGLCVVLWFGLLGRFQNLPSPANVRDMVV